MRAEIQVLMLASLLWAGAVTAQSPNPFLLNPSSPESGGQDEQEDAVIDQARAEWVQILAQYIAMKWLRPPACRPDCA